MGIIALIQRNHHVVVLDSEDEPYVDPDDWTGTSTRTSSSGTGASAMKQFMIDYGHKWKLSMKDFDPTVDTEGHNMVEFKSKPKPLLEALDLLDKMLEMIRDIGDTSSGHAGLHTNMSLKSDKFTKQNFKFKLNIY